MCTIEGLLTAEFGHALGTRDVEGPQASGRVEQGATGRPPARTPLGLKQSQADNPLERRVSRDEEHAIRGGADCEDPSSLCEYSSERSVELENANVATEQFAQSFARRNTYNVILLWIVRLEASLQISPIILNPMHTLLLRRGGKSISHTGCWPSAIQRRRQLDMCVDPNGVSEPMLYNWPKHFRGMGVDNVRQHRELKQENTRLKMLLADREFEIDAMKEVMEKSSEAASAPSLCP